jgi:hypothetical protein
MDELPPELVTIIVVLACRIESCAGLLRTVCRQWRDIIDQNCITPKTSPIWIDSVSKVEWAIQNGMYRGNSCKCRTCVNVSKYNYLKMLEYMRYKCNRSRINMRFSHYDVLQWIRDRALGLYISPHTN